MRADSHTTAIAVMYRSTTESITCHIGTPNGILTIITIGELSGNREAQKASGPSVFSMLPMAAYIEKIITIIIGIINCEESS